MNYVSTTTTTNTVSLSDTFDPAVLAGVANAAAMLARDAAKLTSDSRNVTPADIDSISRRIGHLADYLATTTTTHTTVDVTLL